MLWVTALSTVVTPAQWTNAGSCDITEGTRGAGRHHVVVQRQFDLASCLVPTELMRTTEDYIAEVLHLLFASNTKISHRKSTVSAFLMPNPSKGGIDSTTRAVVNARNGLLRPVSRPAKSGR
eukprot:3434509-Amphidinium_carterae.2